LLLMRDRALWLLVLTSPPLVLGIVVVAATLVVCAARDREGMGSAVAR
jgi:hypothetical protein